MNTTFNNTGYTIKYNVFDPDYDKQPNTPQNLHQCGLYDVFRVMYSGVYVNPSDETWAKDIEQITRDIRASDDKAERNRLKQQLPQFFPCTFKRYDKSNDAKTQINDIAQHTGLMVFDVDGIESPAELRKSFDQLKKLNFVYFVFVSPSGNGIKFGIQTNITEYLGFHDAFEDNDLYSDIYKRIVESLVKADIIPTPDKSTCNLNRGTYIPARLEKDDVYFNPNASIKNIKQETVSDFWAKHKQLAEKRAQKQHEIKTTKVRNDKKAETYAQNQVNKAITSWRSNIRHNSTYHLGINLFRAGFSLFEVEMYFREIANAGQFTDANGDYKKRARDIYNQWNGDLDDFFFDKVEPTSEQRISGFKSKMDKFKADILNNDGTDTTDAE